MKTMLPEEYIEKLDHPDFDEMLHGKTGEYEHQFLIDYPEIAKQYLKVKQMKYDFEREQRHLSEMMHPYTMEA